MAATDSGETGPWPLAPAANGEGVGARDRDAWLQLSAHTPARIALGRAGGSLRTRSLLELRVAHAGARDAVHEPFAPGDLDAALSAEGLRTERLATGARDRASYLARPDLGRTLAPESESLLRDRATVWGRLDLAILVSDGLSARAVGAHAATTVLEVARIARSWGWALYPVFIVPLARVKLQDQVGEILGARLAVILLGERPGLSAHDSLGAYLTFAPRMGCTDADRNCVSNIRAEGLAPMEAARRVADLLCRARRLGLSGTALREP